MKNYFFTLGTKIVNTKNCKSRIVNVLVMLFILFGLTDAFGQTTETITTTGAGTWTAPCGVTSITVQAWGAGGSGGGTQANNTTGGGGGAGDGNNNANADGGDGGGIVFLVLTFFYLSKSSEVTSCLKFCVYKCINYFI